MTIPPWLGLPLTALVFAFIVFAFRQGDKVKPDRSGAPPEENGIGWWW